MTSLHDFGVAYEKKTVLEGVNTTIRRGRITAIIGPWLRQVHHAEGHEPDAGAPG